MTVKDITSEIEKLAPLHYAESFDNVGLLIGNYQTKVTGVLVTLDTLESVIDEAIAKKCNLIVSFHPIIFSGLKKINGNSYVERVVLKAIQNNIAIYATHTALDNAFEGVNAKICDVLGLVNKQVLIPQKNNNLKKLTTYVPNEHVKIVRESLFLSGAGQIGNYSNCSFNSQGEGTFKGTENSNPFVGEKGTIHFEKETQISVVFEKHFEHAIIQALHQSHPYEEVAYEIISIENTNKYRGIGMLAELPKALDAKTFLNFVKKTMQTDCIRHSKLIDKPIQKVAVLGGSGSFAISEATKQGADAYITSDIKYHEFYKAENKLLLADIGHYESEQFTKNLLVAYLTKKFPNFAIILSVKNTNPIHYL